MVWAVSQVRKLAATEPLAGVLEAEMSPGGKVQSQKDVLQWIKDTVVPCTGHWMGTVPLGRVLTEKMAVEGVKGLRVADNSVWPFQLNGNCQASAWLAGERVVDFATESMEEA